MDKLWIDMREGYLYPTEKGEGQRIVYIYWYMGVSFHWRTPTLWVSFPRSPTLFSRTSAGQRWGRGGDKVLNTSTKVEYSTAILNLT